MGNQLKEKYGLATATALVVGIVIGSGVFFKAEKVLSATGGNLSLGIFAWVIGACIMISCAYTFAVMATKYVNVNGVVDYAENIMGEKYAYMLGWFVATIYCPALTSVLAWVSARYTSVLFGFDIVGPQCMVIAGFYLIASYCLNVLSPSLAGKFQVSTTVIKLIPLGIMAVIGTIVGLSSGMTQQNFSTVVEVIPIGEGLFTAVVATAFAYEGWILATTINSELKDSKKNLPKALLAGTFIIATVYICYYIGLSGTVTNETLMAGGEQGARIAFSTIFGEMGGTLMFVLVVISCLGTLNGLMLTCTRGFYSLAARGRGIKPKMVSQIDKETNMPSNAAVLGLFVASAWLFFFYGANLTDPWFGFLSFDSSELPIVALYASYIPMFIVFMKKEKDLNIFQRFIMPFLALVGSIFMVIAAIFSHGQEVIGFLVVFLVIMTIATFYYRKKE